MGGSKFRETERVFPVHFALQRLLQAWTTFGDTFTEGITPPNHPLILQDPDLDLRRGSNVNVPCHAATTGPSFLGNYFQSAS